MTDKTGIQGSYRLALIWAPDDAAGPLARASTVDSGPSIFTAIQEQLGLKLDSQKGPVTVLVIDHFELPTAN